MGTNPHGELLPLPFLARTGGLGTGVSRGVRQRRARVDRCLAKANETVEALNYLFLGPTNFDKKRPQGGIPSPVQRSALSRVLEAHRSNTRPPGVLKPEEALRALLHRGSAYGAGQGCLAHYKAGEVSLPPCGVEPTPVLSVLSGDAHSELFHWREKMLLSPEEHGAVVDSISSIGCYSDPALVRDSWTYARFVVDLLRRNLIRMSTTPQSRLGSSL